MAKQPIKGPATTGSAAPPQAEGNAPDVSTPPVNEAATSAQAAHEASVENAGVEKVRPATEVRETVVERADVSRDQTGEPASVELKAERPLAETDLGRAGLRRAFADTSRFAGTLPAKRRVTAEGRSVEIAHRTDGGKVRLFTAASPILRNGVLYDIGAERVPLSQTEFETKSACGAIVERLFDLGREEQVSDQLA